MVECILISFCVDREYQLHMPMVSTLIMYNMPHAIYPDAVQTGFEHDLARLVANELPWMSQYRHSQTYNSCTSRQLPLFEG
jgi:hypothetical protein